VLGLERPTFKLVYIRKAGSPPSLTAIERAVSLLVAGD
jgi:hypothetical protein